MTTEQQMLTKARRRLISESNRAFDEWQRASDSEKARKSMRQRFIKAALSSVESLDFEALPPADELGRRLDAALHVAPFSGEYPELEQDRKALQASLVEAVESPEGVEALPYRRTLGSAEVTELWNSLDDRWAVRGPGWIGPPHSDGPAPGAQMFMTLGYDWLDDVLRKVVAALGVERVYELEEGERNGCLVDVEWWEPLYGGVDTYSTPTRMNWLICASHEESIVIGGDELLQAVVAAGPLLEELRAGS